MKDILYIVVIVCILTVAIIKDGSKTQVPMSVGDDNEEVCFQTGYQDAECFKFIDVFNEDQHPYQILSVNPDTKILTIRVDSGFTTGSDAACQMFGALINNMLEQMPEGWAIYVANNWVPSKKNPIDLGWSRELAKGY